MDCRGQFLVLKTGVQFILIKCNYSWNKLVFHIRTLIFMPNSYIYLDKHELLTILSIGVHREWFWSVMEVAVISPRCLQLTPRADL